MEFVYYDVGYVEKGKVIEVTLGYAANVSIMESSDYYSYKNGNRHNYYGGYVKKSPYLFTVPHSTSWYVTIDLGGYGGTIKSAVRVLS